MERANPEFAEEAIKPYERFAAAGLDITAITSDDCPYVGLCGAVAVLPLPGGIVSLESTLAAPPDAVTAAPQAHS